MTTYTVEVPERDERGVRVGCDEHGEGTEFQPGYRTVSFYCDGCGRELEVTVHVDDWRDLGEIC
jgi:uncharacterized protein (DUF983 family)